MTRVVFMGTPDVAVPSLQALHAAPDLEVVAVVTNPDRARGRSRTPRPSPVKQAALALGLQVWQPDRGRDVATDLAAVDADVCAVVAYGSLLPREVLDIPRLGFVNLHFSLLPRWRGAAPVQHAIRAGDQVTGITTFLLDEGMDTGPVIASHEVAIDPTETAGELLDRMAMLGAPHLVESLRDLAAGVVPTPQPDDGVTMAPKIGTDDVAIDFSRPATEVAALVRSAAPRPGAHTTWRGDRFKVLGAVAVQRVAERPIVAHVTDLEAQGTAVGPGTVIAADGDGLVVACGADAILATSVQPAGKPAMAAADFVNGYRPTRGERLGG